MARWLNGIGRTWLTGLLVTAAALGYLFYSLLWVMRLAQTGFRNLVFLLVVVGVLAGLAIPLYLLFPPGDPGPDMELIITPGTPLRSTAALLKKEGVVKSRTGLLLWVKILGIDRKIQAGRFIFRRNEGIYSAAQRLLRSEPIERTITITEGMIIEQTASVLVAGLGIDSAVFVALCYSDSLTKELGIQASTLEGYLFPDTYRFPENVSPAEVIRAMVRRFETMYSKVVQDSAIIKRLNRHEIVTMASIVEKEATVAEERTRISGVFHNRLRLGYPLGADPTVRYFLRKFSGPLRVSELNTQSPYNTRIKTGLPPGPICSPGFASLQAAASPMQTRDLYFVARWDGSGAHDFSETNAEHDRKKMAARARNEQARREQQKTKKSIPAP